MSNFLRGFSRTAGLTDDTGDDNVSGQAAMSRLISSRGQTRKDVHRKMRRGIERSNNGGGDINFPTNNKGASRDGDNTHQPRASGQTLEGGGTMRQRQREGGEHYPLNRQHGGPQGRGMRGVPLTVGNDDD